MMPNLARIKKLARTWIRKKRYTDLEIAEGGGTMLIHNDRIKTRRSLEYVTSLVDGIMRPEFVQTNLSTTLQA